MLPILFCATVACNCLAPFWAAIYRPRFRFTILPLVMLFRVTFSETGDSAKRKAEEEQHESKEIFVEPYVVRNRGPYPYNKPKK